MPRNELVQIFDHQKLEVYKLAFEFFKEIRKLARQLTGDDAVIKWQLLRAALSIQLNIAEGSGDFHPKEKARFYRMSRRSAHECAALLEVTEFVLGLKPTVMAPHYTTLRRIIAMLINLDKSMATRAAALKRTPPKKRSR